MTDTGVFCVMATVVNERTNVRLSVPLVNAEPATFLMIQNSHSKFQNFFEVVSNDATPRLNGGCHLVLR